MAHNLICNMDHLLQPFVGLQELSLSHNQLDHFPRGLPSSLESLVLRENLIIYITTGALRRLGNLIRLDLEENRIRVIQPGALLGLSRLKILLLKGNRLSGIPLDMPPSLTHLDVSDNCILALEVPSLLNLVNLQILKISSNSLQTIPEHAFDRLPHLYSVELANNLWVCGCEIAYLYHWLKSGRLRMAADLVCAAPHHLAHQMLATLSITMICPGQQAQNASHEKLITANQIESVSQTQTLTGLNQSSLQTPIGSRKLYHTTIDMPYHTDSSSARFLAVPYSLGGLTYEDCLSLSKSGKTVSTPSPQIESICFGQSTGHQPATLSSVAQPVSTHFSAGEASFHSSPAFSTGSLHPKQIVTILSILCLLTGLLLVGVLLLLKMALVQNQRVFPMQEF